MSLSYENKNGFPIAINRHFHKNKNKIVYLNPIEKDGIEIDDIGDDVLKMVYGSKVNSQKKKEMYKMELLDKLKQAEKKEHRILSLLKRDDNKSNFVPLPPPLGLERNTYYITGQAGSGKSYYCKQLLENYYKLGYKCYFVSPREDASFTNNRKRFKCEYIHINELVIPTEENLYQQDMEKYKLAKIKFKYKKKLLDDEQKAILEHQIEQMRPNPEEKTKNSFKLSPLYYELIEKPTFFICDDWEGYSKPLKEKCIFWLDSMLLLDRKNNVNVAVISHLSTNRGETRNILNETQNYVIFNRNLFKSYSYLLKEYLGMDNKLIKRIKHNLENSRSVCINRIHRYVICEHKIYLF